MSCKKKVGGNMNMWYIMYAEFGGYTKKSRYILNGKEEYNGVQNRKTEQMIMTLPRFICKP